jgi:hypothetical protein
VHTNTVTAIRDWLIWQWTQRPHFIGYYRLKD